MQIKFFAASSHDLIVGVGVAVVSQLEAENVFTLPNFAQNVGGSTLSLLFVQVRAPKY